MEKLQKGDEAAGTPQGIVDADKWLVENQCKADAVIGICNEILAVGDVAEPVVQRCLLHRAGQIEKFPVVDLLLLNVYHVQQRGFQPGRYVQKQFPLGLRGVQDVGDDGISGAFRRLRQFKPLFPAVQEYGVHDPGAVAAEILPQVVNHALFPDGYGVEPFQQPGDFPEVALRRFVVPGHGRPVGDFSLFPFREVEEKQGPQESRIPNLVRAHHERVEMVVHVIRMVQVVHGNDGELFLCQKFSENRAGVLLPVGIGKIEQGHFLSHPFQRAVEGIGGQDGSVIAGHPHPQQSDVCAFGPAMSRSGAGEGGGGGRSVFRERVSVHVSGNGSIFSGERKKVPVRTRSDRRARERP